MRHPVMTNDAWYNQYNTEHVVLWVRWLRAKGFEPEASRGEIDRWRLDDVTQVCVGQHTRIMPTDFVSPIVERVLGDEPVL
jgi:hypothetical protein